MTLNVSISANDLVLGNTKTRFSFHFKSGRYDLHSIHGALYNLLISINIYDKYHEQKSKNGKDPVQSIIRGKNCKKALKNLILFTPVRNTNSKTSKSRQNVNDMNQDIDIRDIKDAIGLGKQVVIPLKFISTEIEGTIHADLIIKLYEPSEEPNDIFLLKCRIKSWDNFGTPPRLHSISCLLGDNTTEWYVTDEYRPLSTNITFFRNGYQSWSTPELLDFDMKAKITPTSVGRINMQNQDKTIKSRYCSEMISAITDVQSLKSIIIGFTTNSRQFNRILMDRLDFKSKFQFLIALSQFDKEPINIIKQDTLESEELYIQFSPPRQGHLSMRNWARITGIQMDSRTLNLTSKQSLIDETNKVLSGWCSWYYYYVDIDQTEMVKNIDFLAEHDEFPIDIIQLDDGYQTTVGDFTSINEKFPKGMKWLVDKIHKNGFIAGLWIAPFFATSKSKLFKEHEDWFLRDKRGKLIKVTFNWGSFLYALDLTKDEVITHIKNLINTIVNIWGFDFIKIDFIYAPEAINAVYQEIGVTRAAALRRGVQAIRDVMNDKILLGCGAPLGPCIGLVDVMRIGTDTAAKWRTGGPLGDWARKYINIDIPALKPALLDTVNRSFMHNFLWINDPDCCVVRENKSSLTLDEIQLQLTIFGLSGGQVFFSDDLSLLPEDRLYYMNLIIPPFRQGAQTLDLLRHNPPRYFGLFAQTAIGSRVLLSVINWYKYQEKETFTIQEILSDLGVSDVNAHKFLIFDYWKGDEFKILNEYNLDERVHLYVIRGHSCKYLSIIPITEESRKSPIFLSSTLHITQGCKEVKKYEFDEKTLILRIEFDMPGMRSGDIYLLTPSELKMKEGFPTGTEVFDTDFGNYLVIPIDLPKHNEISLMFEKSD
ncbi:MAG: hypothetical protein GF364_11730 [Candidatus Lokiarchaeota archaeon]|nr:hypothetical protein [Candidatus Lokiarchaeota archaeon]